MKKVVIKVNKQYVLYLEQHISFCIGCEHKNGCHFKKFVKLDSLEDYQEKIWKEPLRITKNNSLVSIPRRKTGGFITVFSQIMKGERND